MYMYDPENPAMFRSKRTQQEQNFKENLLLRTWMWNDLFMKEFCRFSFSGPVPGE